MDELERANLHQIEALNQRGGRTLSIVDLVLANTISAEAAARVGAGIAGGASFLTAANPGGAGKTALLAALLGFLPSGVPIVTIDGPGSLSAAERAGGGWCCLAHEIGAGHWYGYVWGREVERYLALPARGHWIASCLHADTLEEVHERLEECSIAEPAAALAGVDYLLFMHVDRPRGRWRHRVAAIYGPGADGRRALLFRWNAEADALEPHDPGVRSTDERPLAELIRSLADKGVRDIAAVRRAILEFRGGCP